MVWISLITWPSVVNSLVSITSKLGSFSNTWHLKFKKFAINFEISFCYLIFDQLVAIQCSSCCHYSAIWGGLLINIFCQSIPILSYQGLKSVEIFNKWEGEGFRPISHISISFLLSLSLLCLNYSHKLKRCHYRFMLILIYYLEWLIEVELHWGGFKCWRGINLNLSIWGD